MPCLVDRRSSQTLDHMGRFSYTYVASHPRPSTIKTLLRSLLFMFLPSPQLQHLVWVVLSGLGNTLRNITLGIAAVTNSSLSSAGLDHSRNQREPEKGWVRVEQQNKRTIGACCKVISIMMHRNDDITGQFYQLSWHCHNSHLSRAGL